MVAIEEDYHNASITVSKLKAKWVDIEEDYHNAKIKTRKQKAKLEALKKITTMLALQQESRKQSG